MQKNGREVLALLNKADLKGLDLENVKGAIFDLDGVIVDTAKYHYLAWSWLAGELGFVFEEKDNERLKGVSRMKSLEILLDIGGLQFSDLEKQDLADRKNLKYLEYIAAMDESELLPGAKQYLIGLKSRGTKIALGSASKNARLILDNMGIFELFDAVIDGNKVSRAKPDPEVFLNACRELQLRPADCVVFEDAVSGVEAAQRAGIPVVGVGDPQTLAAADRVIGGLYELAR